jgi:hypothetical protein
MARRGDQSDVSPFVKSEFIAGAVRQWKQADDAETEQRREALEDLNFLNLDQWPANVKALRNEKGQERPTLTIDQIGQPWRQLVTQQQKANSAIRIIPEQGDANKETAEITQGLIRAIEYQSEAKTAYGICYATAVGAGFGYVRVRSDYESPTSFDQRILIEGVENPFSVYIDPAAQEPDRSDMRYAFITEDVPVDEYRRRFPQSAAADIDYDRTRGPLRARDGRFRAYASLTQLAGVGDDEKTWFPDGVVRIAEFYYVEHETFDIAELASGEVVSSKDIDLSALGDQVVRRRRTDVPVVRFALINAIEILDGADDEDEPCRAGDERAPTQGRIIPGTSIPLRPCYGEQLNVNGKRVYRGIVRQARDPQQMYNYQNSALVEDLALAPKSPIVGVEGQFEGHEDKWEQANTRAFPYLEYVPVSLGGQYAPAPTRPPSVDPAKITATVQAINQAKADLRSTTGWYDTTDPGRRNADQSGVAIRSRKLQQEETGLAFQENFRRLLISIGKLLLEWIPVIYDRPGRILQVLGMEDSQPPQWAILKQPFTRDRSGRALPVGSLNDPSIPSLFYDPSKGVYGVRVTIGASHETRKQEAADALGRLLEANPAWMQIFGDLYVRNLDIPDADEIADRIKRTIPPNVLAEDKGSLEANLPPEVQQTIQQAQQTIAQLQQQLQQANMMIQTKQVEAKNALELQQIKTQGDAMMTKLEQEARVHIASLQHEIDLLKVKTDAYAVSAKIDAERTALGLQQEQTVLDRNVQLLDMATADAPSGPASPVEASSSPGAGA